MKPETQNIGNFISVAQSKAGEGVVIEMDQTPVIIENNKR